MNDNTRYRFSSNGPRKQVWILQKLPIKDGGVLRSAMQEQLFRREIKWIKVEDVIKS